MYVTVCDGHLCLISIYSARYAVHVKIFMRDPWYLRNCRIIKLKHNVYHRIIWHYGISTGNVTSTFAVNTDTK